MNKAEVLILDKAGALSRSVSAPAASTAAATATSVTATATSSAATSATARTAAAATATAAFRHGTRFIHNQSAAEEILPVAHGDGTLCFAVVFEIDKSKTARLAGEAIPNDLDRVGTETRACEPILQLCFGGLVGQVSNKQSFQRSSFGPN